jgi:hypothetical protein
MRKSRRGMMLLTTLVVTFVLALFIGAGLTLLPTNSHSDHELLAEQAAQAGLDYARVRLQEEPSWRGGLNRVVVNTSELYIEEQNGNVIGLIRSRPGDSFSMFRFRFNFQNGPASTDPLDDGFDDPPSSHYLKSELVSVNNLTGGVRALPRADSTYSVTDFSTGPYQIPEGTVVVCVEGLAGPGLSAVGPGNLGIGSGRVATQQTEVLLKASFSTPAKDAAIMAGGTLDLYLPTGSEKVEIKAKEDTARARAKGDITVHAGATPNYVSEGEVSVSSSANLNASLSSDVTVVTEGDTDPFYTLDWSDIHRADSSATSDTAAHIPGGTYVWWDDNSFHYYDLDFTDYKSYVALNPTDPGIVLSDDLAEVRSATNLSNSPNGVKVSGGKFEVKKDLLVVPSTGAVSDFTLIPRRGTQSSSADSSGLTGFGSSSYAKDFEFSMKPIGSQASPTVTIDGDTLISAEIGGKDGGSLVVDGNLRVDAAKLEKYSAVGISMYCSGDLDISTYHPEDNSYGKIKVEGMYYAWGDLNVLAGEPAIGEFADVEFKGALVAYGTGVEPSTSLPGSNGGDLAIYGKKVKIEWDAKKLGDLLDAARLSSLTKLDVMSFIRH